MLSRTSKTNVASISLKFVVVGGGIAGLATAYKLKRAGHSVIVLEKRDHNSMSFGMGGIRVPPHMLKLLYTWGLGPILSEKALKSDKVLFVNANSGKLLGWLNLHDEFLKDFRTDQILIQHCELINIFYDLAVREGVEIRQNANVIHADPCCVTVWLDTGETVSGDIIVAADGYTSSLRSSVMGYPEEDDLESGERMLYVAFTLDTSLLKDDPSFKIVLASSAYRIMWLGEDTALQTHITNGCLIGSISRNYKGPLKEGDQEWSNARDLESYGLDFTALDPRKPFPAEFVNDSSSIVLVGEAAHPFVYDGGHGAAMVFEDAETLGSLFSRLQCREQIKQLLTAYEEIRHPRCEDTCQEFLNLESANKCPMGPQQEARDALFRQVLADSKDGHMDEPLFRSLFSKPFLTYTYDASEAVDNWWVQWGPLLSPPESIQCKSVLTDLQIWISEE